MNRGWANKLDMEDQSVSVNVKGRYSIVESEAASFEGPDTLQKTCHVAQMNLSGVLIRTTLFDESTQASLHSGTHKVYLQFSVDGRDLAGLFTMADQKAMRGDDGFIHLRFHKPQHGTLEAVKRALLRVSNSDYVHGRYQDRQRKSTRKALYHLTSLPLALLLMAGTFLTLQFVQTTVGLADLYDGERMMVQLAMDRIHDVEDTMLKAESFEEIENAVKDFNKEEITDLVMDILDKPLEEEEELIRHFKPQDKKKIEEKLKNLTHEEKERIKAKFKALPPNEQERLKQDWKAQGGSSSF